MKNMNQGKFYAFFTVLLALSIFWQGFSVSNEEPVTKSPDAAITNIDDESSTFLASATAVYDRLNLEAMGLSYKAFEYAVRGLEKLKLAGKVANDDIISIVDFTKPSSKKRLFIIDLEKQKLLYNTYVAHGRKSGKEMANNFSNKPESYQSSLGFFVTSGTYMGKNGYSMQLEGLEKGFNDKASSRAIVMHGAPYVDESLARSQGYIGRSHGCPAVPENLNRPIIEKIKNGTCLFIYAEQKNYMNHSKLLNS